MTRTSLYVGNDTHGIKKRIENDIFLKRSLFNFELLLKRIETIKFYALTTEVLEQAEELLEDFKIHEFELAILDKINESLLAYQNWNSKKALALIKAAFKSIQDGYNFVTETYHAGTRWNRFRQRVTDIIVSACNARGLIERSLSARNPKENLAHLEESYHYYTLALEMDPNNAEIHHNLGWLLIEELGHLDAGYEHHERAYKLHPNDAAIINGMAYACHQRKEHERAEPLFFRAYKLEEKNPIISRYYAWFLLDRGNFKKARELLEKATETCYIDYVGYYTYYYYLAIAKAAQGDFDGAIKDLNEAKVHCLFANDIHIIPETVEKIKDMKHKQEAYLIKPSIENPPPKIEFRKSGWNDEQNKILSIFSKKITTNRKIRSDFFARQPAMKKMEDEELENADHRQEVSSSNNVPRS